MVPSSAASSGGLSSPRPNLLGCVPELFVCLLHGGLEILAGLLPGLVLERYGALAHTLALVLAGLFAATAFARTVVVAFAHVILDRGTVRLACTIVFLPRHLALAGGVQAAT